MSRIPIESTARAVVVRQRPQHLSGLLVSGAVLRPIEDSPSGGGP